MSGQGSGVRGQLSVASCVGLLVLGLPIMVSAAGKEVFGPAKNIFEKNEIIFALNYDEPTYVTLCNFLEQRDCSKDESVPHRDRVPVDPDTGLPIHTPKIHIYNITTTKGRD